jgi:hypothetical protein
LWRWVVPAVKRRGCVRVRDGLLLQSQPNYLVWQSPLRRLASVEGVVGFRSTVSSILSAMSRAGFVDVSPCSNRSEATRDSIVDFLASEAPVVDALREVCVEGKRGM